MIAKVTSRSRTFVPLSRRAFATLIVLAALIIAITGVGILQVAAIGQASSGREALAQVRAQWAARAGVEAMIARLEFDTENPTSTDAYKTMDDMVAVAERDFDGSSYRVATFDDGKEVLGPADAHAKININRLSADQMLELEPLMTEDIADALIDWIDADDDSSPLGAEAGYYQGSTYPYEPRNAPIRSIAELELIAGVDQEDVRGEDWNLNSLLDPNEDDGDVSWPPDNADGKLDAAWSGILTADSVDSVFSKTGEELLDLTSASAEVVIQRTGVDSTQAQVIVDYVQRGNARSLSDFIVRDLTQMNRQLNPNLSRRQAQVPPLSVEQLGALLDETTIGGAAVAVALGGQIPGKINVNTASVKVLESIPEISSSLADSIIAERAARGQGFNSVAQMLEVPGMTRRELAVIYELLTTRSNVYVVTSRGKDTRTGIEIEMTVVLDRSTLPVTLKEIKIR